MPFARSPSYFRLPYAGEVPLIVTLIAANWNQPAMVLIAIPACLLDKIKAPEDFIELCASRSLLSGKPYLVINEKGEKISASEWLRTELVVYRTSVAGESH